MHGSGNGVMHFLRYRGICVKTMQNIKSICKIAWFLSFRARAPCGGGGVA